MWGLVPTRSLITVSLAQTAVLQCSHVAAHARHGGGAVADSRLDVAPLSALPTPAQAHDAPRCIVGGGEVARAVMHKVVRSPETCFYTPDHYQSFEKIDPSR